MEENKRNPYAPIDNNMEQPGVNYGGQPGANYGGQPGANYGGQPGANYGGQPGANYGGQPGANYGGQPGVNYGGQPGANYGGQPGTNYGGQPGTNYGGQPGTNYGRQPGANYGGQPGIMLQGSKPQETAASAVISLVFGILSILSFIIVPFPIVGIICGIIGIKTVSKNKNTKKGKGLALTGLILSCVNMAFICMIFAVIVPAIAGVVDGAGKVYDCNAADKLVEIVENCAADEYVYEDIYEKSEDSDNGDIIFKVDDISDMPESFQEYFKNKSFDTFGTATPKPQYKKNGASDYEIDITDELGTVSVYAVNSTGSKKWLLSTTGDESIDSDYDCHEYEGKKIFGRDYSWYIDNAVENMESDSE